MAAVRIGINGQVQLQPRELSAAMELPANQDWLLTGLPRVTSEGRAGAFIGVCLPNGRWALQPTTLRTLYSGVKALVLAHGEGWMQDEWGLRFQTDKELRLAMMTRSLALQLMEMHHKLGGTGPTFDMTAADVEYERVRNVLDAVASFVAVVGEFGGLADVGEFGGRVGQVYGEVQGAYERLKQAADAAKLRKSAPPEAPEAPEGGG